MKLLTRYLRDHPHGAAGAAGAGPLWMGERGPLTVNGVRAVLRRLGAPAAHSWRRGWAVASLRDGVSQVSVEAAAGWAPGSPMAARYTRALRQELSMHEFSSKRWVS